MDGNKRGRKRTQLQGYSTLYYTYLLYRYCVLREKEGGERTDGRTRMWEEGKKDFFTVHYCSVYGTTTVVSFLTLSTYTYSICLYLGLATLKLQNVWSKGGMLI